MKQYKHLNLAAIRKTLDIDFAHYTFLRGQCSCCYGPDDMPARYWKNGIVKDSRDASYILFKNATNGSGIVNRNSWITDNTYILYDNLTPEQISNFCKLLQEQLDSDYLVLEPVDTMRCICIKCKSEGLFKIRLSNVEDYHTSFDMSEIRKLKVANVDYIYFNNDFKIIKGE